MDDDIMDNKSKNRILLETILLWLSSLFVDAPSQLFQHPLLPPYTNESWDLGSFINSCHRRRCWCHSAGWTHNTVHPATGKRRVFHSVSAPFLTQPNWTLCQDLIPNCNICTEIPRKLQLSHLTPKHEPKLSLSKSQYNRNGDMFHPASKP
jgi:hypothetical protein